MDKSQTPPGRDGGSEDSGKKEHYGKPVKAKDFAKHAEKELNKAMDKTKARKMYELADQLSKVDTSKLNEQQVAERTAMIKRLGEELKAMKVVAEARDTGNDIDDIVEDYLDYLEQHGGFDYPTREEEKASIMADIESGALHPDELEYAMSGNNDMNEAPEEDLHTSYNVVKLGGALNVDPRGLRMAIARGLKGNPTRTDMMTLSNAFLNLLKNSDDAAIQKFANLVKTGNPRDAGKEIPQESTAAIAERNAFVDAMRQVKKGEKFTVGGKEFTKTTSHGEDESVKEAIDTEAYDRLKRVFDFSDYKG